MSETGSFPWIPGNFLALPPDQSDLDGAGVVLIPVPYDSTTSFRSGAREGPGAIIEASYGLEDYDCELDSDVSLVGIHTTPALEPHMGGPAAMVQRVRQAVGGYTGKGKLVGVLGGEHSIATGSVQAHLESHPDLSVLYLDAHADLRDSYMGTPWGHASGARRIHEMCPLVLVGVRSLALEERDYIRSASLPTFFWPPPGGDGPSMIGEILDRLGSTVYISVDLDVLDPSMMSAVGTPEPGGMDWYQLTALLKGVAESRRIVGFDVCELSPSQGVAACSYIAAKLVYKLLAYATLSYDGALAGDGGLAGKG
ncbi:MAG: agmatinase [Chloroflexi bacterium]|nr:agmatinase [Chloroflexota bacterium]MCI0857440.1 agmatinase [Chloroflexota bacterium]